MCDITVRVCNRIHFLSKFRPVYSLGTHASSKAFALLNSMLHFMKNCCHIAMAANKHSVGSRMEASTCVWGKNFAVPVYNNVRDVIGCMEISCWMHQLVRRKPMKSALWIVYSSGWSKARAKIGNLFLDSPFPSPEPS